MSILFDDASSQYLSYAGAIDGNLTVSFSCWFQTNDTTVAQVLMSIGDSATTNQATLLLIVGGQLRLTCTVSGVAGSATSVASATTNTWYHAAGTLLGGQKRVYLNGLEAVNTLVGGSVYAPDRTFIGRRANNGTANYHSGLIAEAAIWSSNISQADVNQLYAGFSPKLVRPDILVAYWPLLDQATPSIDLRGGFNMTWNAAPTVGSSHPAMFGG